jgi:hypothetical protein
VKLETDRVISRESILLMIITDEHKEYLLGVMWLVVLAYLPFCDGGVCPHFRGRSLAEIDRTVSIGHLFRIRESGGPAIMLLLTAS